MTHTLRSHLLKSIASIAVATAFMSSTAHSIIPSENEDADSIIDTDGGVNGIGMFYTSQGGVCTGTLINARTVIFAAHCVNRAPESAYGTQIFSSFSFNVDAFPGVLDWFQNGFTTNENLLTYNVSQIQYNPASIARPEARGFLEGDVAIATLDTPVVNVPTWALMFSPLPTPDAIDPVTGTGYHVNIAGYGRTGSAFGGDFQGIDFRRRAAENMLGALGSLDDRGNGLNAVLGSPSNFTNFPQNLYFIDFDSLNRDYFPDVNVFRDDALPNEGATAGGDSGGPLILDAANNDGIEEDLLLGVLSGGGPAFNFGQPGNTYGDISFYQPLYLFADYIAAANPYRYVSALAGDGAWEDATHWQSDLDPNYRIIDASGAIVNGFPDDVSAGVTGSTPDFGQVCVDTAFFGIHGCQDLATGDLIDVTPAPPAPAGGGAGATNGTANLQNNMGQVDLGSLANLGLSTNGPVANDFTQLSLADLIAENGNTDAASAAAASQNPVAALPAPTIDNGLAGATNFVPNNIDPDIVAGINGRYFDVTLSADGTTSVNSDIVIDRLTITGASTGLNITDGSTLFSNIDISQMSGTMTVDGAIGTAGDYLLMSGLLQGNGIIFTPFLTNIAGAISPGDFDTVGELNVVGSLVLSSGSNLFINISENGVSDHINVFGDSSVGGNVFFIPDASVREGNEYTFLSTAGAQSGEMTATDISGVLYAELVHNANDVSAIIRARSFDTVIAPQNQTQSAFAKMLDANRGGGGLSELFNVIDLQSGNDIRAIMDSWAPVTETTVRSLGKATMQGNSNFFRNRLSRLSKGDLGGTMTTAGADITKFASNGMVGWQSTKYASADGDMQTRQRSGFKTDLGWYMIGGYVDGSGTAMPGFSDDDSFDGWNVFMGADKKLSDNFVMGLGVNYSKIDAMATMGQTAASEHYGGTVYAQYKRESGVAVDGMLSLGQYSSETSRTVALAGAPLTTKGEDRTYGAEIGLSRAIEAGGAIVSPGVRLRHNVIKFGAVTENGALPALALNRDQYESSQALIGFDYDSNSDNKLDVSMSVHLVKSLSKDDGNFQASFVNGNGTTGTFATFSEDDFWGEIGLGLTYRASDMIDLSISGETNMGREDVKVTTVQAGIRASF